MTDLPGLLSVLSEANVRFVVIGGMAGIAHGAARVTYDLDCVYERTPANLSRLATALKVLSPSLRDAPPGLPFVLDEGTLAAGLNFTLETTSGPLDTLA